MNQARKNNHRQNGTALFVATAAFIFLIPMIGLAVDVGFLYSVRSKLQASVDGASLAAARALSLGATTADQKDSAKHNAVNWFYANFPPGSWGSKNTLMTIADTYVNVYDDATNPNLRHVDVFASTQVPTLFMRWFGQDAILVNAKGYASRRDVNAMMVLDRSGSMCGGSSTPCNSSNAGCGGLISAAKTFTGQFANGRDKIGAISFASNSYLHSAPTASFQTTLGYTNSLGTANGELDTIVCNGGTGSPGAIALAYNELYKLNQPGALNLIVFETDGKPNEVVVNEWSGGAAGISTSSPNSTCTDNNNRRASGSPAGFTTFASLPSWTNGHSMNTGGTGYIADIPAGIIGGVGGYDTGTSIGILWDPWLSAKISGSDKYNESSTFVGTTTGTNAHSCAFGSSHTSNGDLAWLPTTDVYGTSLIDNSYKSITLSNGKIPVSMDNIRSASFNAVSNSAYNFRTNGTIPVYTFAVGFTAGVDHVLLQRFANDPDWLSNAACTSSGDCVNYTTQNQGTYVFASNTAQLMSAFLSLSSQILRLSR